MAYSRRSAGPCTYGCSRSRAACPRSSRPSHASCFASPPRARLAAPASPLFMRSCFVPARTLCGSLIRCFTGDLLSMSSFWTSGLPETMQATESSPSIWPNEGMVQNVASSSTLQCLSRMLTESIHTDVTMNTADGVLKAHKAILLACSPVFERMFLHDLKEKKSSTINIDDMSLESCSALLGYMYGTIRQDQFQHQRLL